MNAAEAAAILRQCRAALAAHGSTIVAEATGGGAVGDWRHYPDGEVYDGATHAQYFFHRHAAPGRARTGGAAEYGHFHLFLRGEGMPAGVTPLLLPELAVANAPTPQHSAPLRLGASDRVCHLVALAVDERGEPLRLFTTNRWVTGETWYRADDVIRMLDRFRLGGDQPSALLNRWLGAFVRLFRTDIATLLQERDRAIVERRWRSRGNALEDQRLEITSSRAVDLEGRLAELERRPASAALSSRARRLPRMVEGGGREYCRAVCTVCRL